MPLDRRNMLYDALVDWRAKRVITDNNFAYAFNWLCATLRSSRGYSDMTDPLPWMRECRDAVVDVNASARYNVDVLTAERPDSQAGEEEVMWGLISDSNVNCEKEFGPSSKIKLLGSDCFNVLLGLIVWSG